MAENTSRLKVEVDGTSASRDIDKITRAFMRLQTAVSKTGSMFSRFGSAGSTAFSRLARIGGGAFRVLSGGFRGLIRVAGTFMSVFRTLLKVITIGAAGFTLFARSIAQAGNSINKFVNTLVILKGNTKDAAAELQILFGLSQRLGTSFEAAATPFVKFAAAAAGTLTDQSIRDVFEAFATAGVALQLTKPEIQGVFLALQQIASKGVVSMEELRLQLAERVPGAMRLAAQSMGMTMIEFEKAVAARTLNAGEFLEKFSAKLKETFKDAAQLASGRLFADIQRLGNELTKFKQVVFVSGFEEGLQTLVKSAINFLNNNPELGTALGKFSKDIFENVASFIDSMSADTVINVINQIIGAFEILINAINRLVFSVRSMFDDGFKAALNVVESQSNQFENLLVKRQEIMARLSNTNVREEHTIGADTFSPMTNNQIIQAESDLELVNHQIVSMRGFLSESTRQARELGIAISEIPNADTDNLGSGRSFGPAEVTLPRIERTGPSGSDLNLSNQPDLDFGATGAQLGALQDAEVMTTMDMPAFYDAVLSGRLREGMDELVLLHHDLSVLNESQAMDLELINEKVEELNGLRDVTHDGLADDVAINDAVRELSMATDEFLTKEEKRIELKKKLLDLLDSEEKKNKRLLTFQEELAKTFTSTRDVFIGIIEKTEDAILQMVTTGKANFTDLANSIIADLTRMAIEAFITRYILGPLMGAFSNMLGDSLGGNFGAVGAAPNTPGFPPSHSGGVSGKGHLAFNGQNRFDGLRNNEQPIIVERGEGIFTTAQMAALAPIDSISKIASRSPGGSPYTIAPAAPVNVNIGGTKIEVINNGASDIETEDTTKPDGSQLVRIIVGTVAKNIANDGDLSQLLKGKFGLSNTTGNR